MAEAVVLYVLGRISETAYNEALFLYRVGDKVEWAKRELEWVVAFLRDADAKQNKDARVKQWVKDVEEVAYMIEDALDKFFVEMGGGRSKGVLKRVSHGPKALIERHKLGIAIDKIKKRLNEIKENRQHFGIIDLERSGGAPVRQPVMPVVVPEIDKTDIVGFEDDINNICWQLRDESVSRRSVISIVGPSGRGKTTVAIKIYKSFREENHFDYCIWITISQEFKIMGVLKKILEKMQKTAREDGDEEYLIREVHASLSEKKYLIILDDVGTSDNWTQLEVALPEDHNGSRVLITTRFTDVAKKSDAANKPYLLQTLSKDESQQLLLKKAFPNQPANKCPDNLLPLIEQFSKKCDGWPLALVVLGGILSMKDPEYNIWNDLFVKMDWKNEGKECLDIINSNSYEDLPYYLKPCFMYLSVFPKDHQINTSSLIQLWIAEGLILQDESTKIMEDIAESYLEELVRRCMIQVSKRSWSGRIKYCNIHDILRELAIRKAKEENFHHLCSKSDVDSIWRTSASTRRIVCHEYGNIEEQIGPSLRSLTDYGRHCPILEPHHELKLRMVRVLHLGGYVGWSNKRAIRDYKWLKPMIALRYFECNRTFIPCEVPDCFWNNKMLRYVNIGKAPFVTGPPTSANLENLLILKSVAARHEWGVKLPHFPRIRKLGVSIHNKIDWAALANSMSKLEHLISLNVYVDRNSGNTDDEQYPCLIPAFRNYKKVRSLYLQFRWPEDVLGGFSLLPSNLLKLTLEWSCLKQDPMPELEKLPNLRVLRLLRDSYKGQQLICSEGGFKCLQQLKLRNLTDLMELKVEEGAMPNLNQLEISDCHGMITYPNFGYLINLREVTINGMPYDYRF